MKKTIKSAILLIMIGMLLFVLTGCVNVNYEIKLEKDGSGDVSYMMGYDKQFLNSIGAKQEDLEGDDTFDEMQDEAEEKGYTVDKYEDELTYGFKASKHVENIQEEFNVGNVIGEDVEDDRIVFEESFLKTKYYQNTNLDLSTLAGEEDALTNAVLGQMKISYKIVLPFKVGENNATTVSEDGKTLEWVLKAAQANEIRFEATEDYTMYAIGGVVGLVLVIATATIILVTNKKKSEKQEEVVVTEEIISEEKQQDTQVQVNEQKVEKTDKANETVEEDKKEEK